MASCIPISDPTLEEIRQETRADESMQVLTKVILQGWPDDKSSVPPIALPYFNQRDELMVQNGLIFRGERVVVRKMLWEVMKQKVHSSHMGMEACLRRARESIYWPGMCAEMKQLVESCETCRQYDCGNQRKHWEVLQYQTDHGNGSPLTCSLTKAKTFSLLLTTTATLGKLTNWLAQVPLLW